ncbi:MAG: metal-dependent hydrolase [Sphingobacteriales bacterium]|nr:metal-dependent hydrolase [Sphingobacteriales bacterium]MBI3717838.1 metal-dependent hydrolase [Sphingobacteriales bacterium]
MDSITHIALGACMGEAFAGKTLGKKAMLWGALAQSIPDIDFISSFWMDTSSGLLAHRGFTHSLLFCAIITPIFALLAEKWHRPHDIRLGRWLLFFGGVIFTHIFIDAFNNYGVGWFEPFSHERISFNSIYVADPFLSVWPGVALIALLYLNRYSPKRKQWWRFGLIIPAFYLGYCLANKFFIDKEVRSVLKDQQISYTRYFTTPAPLQNWLWYVVAGNDTGYYVGFRSLFDKEKKISFEYFPRNDSLLRSVSNHEDLQKLIRFSQQFYTIEYYSDTLVFNDLRFGQIIGWKEPREKFVFHYYLQHPDDNKLVVQRGRFAKWDWEVVQALWRRMKGN